MAGRLLKQAFAALRAKGVVARLNLTDRTRYGDNSPLPESEEAPYCYTEPESEYINWGGMDTPLIILNTLAEHGIRATWRGTDGDCVLILNPED